MTARTGRGDMVLAAGLAMVAAALVWKFELIRRTYFRQDDFMFIARGLEQGLTWDYLMRIDWGHLMPAPFAIHWAMGRLGVYNEVLAHAVTVCLLAAAGLAVLRLLRVLFGSRPAILLPLGFYLLTPMTLPSTVWWAVVVEILPFQTALAMALSSHVLYTRTQRFRHALAAAGWTVVGMAFFVKAPFIPVLALVLTLGWLNRSGTRRVWLLYAAVLVPYTVIFFRQLFTTVQLTNVTFEPALPSAEVAAGTAWKLLTGSLVPASLGGPWDWQPIGDDYALGAPPAALMWAACAAAAVAVALSVRHRRRAWLAWTMLLGYVLLADVVPIWLGRASALGADLAGFELRYVSSTAALVTVVIGLAFIPVAGEERPWLRPPPSWSRRAWAPAAAVVAAGSVWSVTAFGALPLGRNVEGYVETARVALARAPSGSVVLDTYVPAKVAEPIFFYQYARVSTVLGPLAPHPVSWTERLSGPVGAPLMFDARGRLNLVDLDGVTVPAGASCTPVGAGEVVFPLPEPLPGDEWTVRVAYLNGAETTLVVRLGGSQAEVRAGRDLGVTYATVSGAGSELALRTIGGAGACVGEIKVGKPAPAENGTPVPARPVLP
ncbi:hypothetical protein OUY22_11100 [Nonomuraea sp. MCN248]|uniref:Glycosyltransferase RgtA/B/C/D-like domain-containing protein n=1 Tax=Nonomuraea corallina TaxID=2989783 RepID=A0ABT4S9V1_9ACTN|nr:hypothetical protein [Nonomuraea corallina]MDA0633964.1 hypothetical protein [Nonomuraea corallina]